MQQAETFYFIFHHNKKKGSNQIGYRKGTITQRDTGLVVIGN